MSHSFKLWLIEGIMAIVFGRGLLGVLRSEIRLRDKTYRGRKAVQYSLFLMAVSGLIGISYWIIFR